MIPVHIRIELNEKNPNFNTCNLSTCDLDDHDILALSTLVANNPNIVCVILKKNLNINKSTAKLFQKQCPNVALINLIPSKPLESIPENSVAIFKNLFVTRIKTRNQQDHSNTTNHTTTQLTIK